MNLGNKLAVGEVVDLGTDETPLSVDIAPEPAVRVEAPAVPVAAHAEH